MNAHQYSSFRLTACIVGVLWLILPASPLMASSSSDACGSDNSTLVRSVEEMFGLGIATSRGQNQGWKENWRARGRYLIFNHSRGIIAKPVPATLQVRNNETFTIIFACTSPEDFDYQIEMIPDDQVSNSTFRDGLERVEVEELENAVSVTWRHDEQFPLYRVSVTQRSTGTVIGKLSADEIVETEIGDHTIAPDESLSLLRSLDTELTFEQLREQLGALNFEYDDYRSWRQRVISQYELASYTFPVWVRTVGWDLSFSSGFSFSGLENPKFDLETVMTDTGEQMIVRRDRDAEDEFRPDLMALANLRFPNDGPAFFRPLGLSFGVGIGQDAEPRYYFGPSIDLGKSFILTAGVAGGKVDALPAGQRINAIAINGGSTLDTLPKRFETTWFAGIAFRFGSDGVQEQFVGRLSGVQKQPTNKATASETEGTEATDEHESTLERIKELLDEATANEEDAEEEEGDAESEEES